MNLLQRGSCETGRAREIDSQTQSEITRAFAAACSGLEKKEHKIEDAPALAY